MELSDSRQSSLATASGLWPLEAARLYGRQLAVSKRICAYAHYVPGNTASRRCQRPRDLSFAPVVLDQWSHDSRN
jgi:hypothetical protein